MERFPVLDALQQSTGDISGYDITLEGWKHRLVELNLCITIENARELCIRDLFRRESLLKKGISGVNEVPLLASTIEATRCRRRRGLCGRYDVQEYMKYTSHEKRMVVLLGGRLSLYDLL
ncbi:hypothetical protein SCLCIDRAFT_1114390 [Scleroderma citrinum Foug A]|uniref:Uncharacterized protein n=1 Tax=Scleroderma citrinum Foug A TaxID=1036808 RepID=A0A0C3DPJ5_9AGAM|nr:hypothetical protein SCLCIDRAFT_1114390 [Scleroderma citrinum Foug A]